MFRVEGLGSKVFGGSYPKLTTPRAPDSDPNPQTGTLNHKAQTLHPTPQTRNGGFKSRRLKFRSEPTDFGLKVSV